MAAGQATPPRCRPRAPTHKLHSRIPTHHTHPHTHSRLPPPLPRQLMCERAAHEGEHRAITVDESGEFRLWNIFVKVRPI